jgi:hypothetical protein
MSYKKNPEDKIFRVFTFLKTILNKWWRVVMIWQSQNIWNIKKTTPPPL